MGDQDMDHRDCLETLDLQVQEVNLDQLDPEVNMALQAQLVNRGTVDLKDFHHQWNSFLGLQGTLVVSVAMVYLVLLENLEFVDLKDGEEMVEHQEGLDKEVLRVIQVLME